MATSPITAVTTNVTHVGVAYRIPIGSMGRQLLEGRSRASLARRTSRLSPDGPAGESRRGGYFQLFGRKRMPPQNW